MDSNSYLITKIQHVKYLIEMGSETRMKLEGSEKLTAMASPRGTEMKRTPRKEHKQAMKSSLSTFHNLYAAW